MFGFIEKRMNEMQNQELSKEVNKYFDIHTTNNIIKDYMKGRGLKRDKKVKRIVEKKIKNTAKIDNLKRRPKIYTDEVVKYLRENVDRLKNKELCVELEQRFGILTNQEKMPNILSTHGIRRDSNFKVNPEIVKYVGRCGITDPILLRDKIIEKFGQYFNTADLNKIKRLAINKSEEESVHVEVKRITQKRDGDDFEDDIDSMG